MGLEPGSVRPCVRPSVRPSVHTFKLEHYWGGEMAAYGFGLDRIRTLVSMATDSSHSVIMGKKL